MILETNSYEETFELARKIASKVEAGTVITLDGDLGVGKTVFAQGFAKGTHCLALKYAEDEIVRSLVIIKGNEGGQVLSIRIADVGKKEFVLCPRRQITLPN